MTGCVVRGICNHGPDCEIPNEAPIMLVLFAEGQIDQNKIASMITELKPLMTKPFGFVKAEGDEIVSLAEALLGVFHHFYMWKQVQKELIERRDKALENAISCELDEDPFSGATEIDTDNVFGSEESK